MLCDGSKQGDADACDGGGSWTSMRIQYLLLSPVRAPAIRFQVSENTQRWMFCSP
jgi:hypothetical protein